MLGETKHLLCSNIIWNWIYKHLLNNWPKKLIVISLFLTGFGNFCDDIYMMLGRHPPMYFKFCWCVTAPIIILVRFHFSFQILEIIPCILLGNNENIYVAMPKGSLSKLLYSKRNVSKVNKNIKGFHVGRGTGTTLNHFEVWQDHHWLSPEYKM